MEKITHPLLEVSEIVGGYKDFHLSSISFQLQKGDFTGIIGPNGSGKSTLMKLILGDLKLSRGAIFLEGKKLSCMPVKEKAKHIAVVTQHIEDASMTVQEYILLGRMPYREPFQFWEKKKDLEMATKYMELTGIARYGNHPLSSLSGGERQLAAMARALTQEPILLLLDEPTSQLDICHQVDVLDLVKKLNKELDLTVLMIIHDLNLASTYCNGLLLMDKGKLNTQGTPKDVLQYRIIEDVYRTMVVTMPNPVTGNPTVFPVPRDRINLLKKERNGFNPSIQLTEFANTDK